MTETVSPAMDRLKSGRRRGVRLETLVRLRWLAVLGQLAAVLFVSLVLGFEMPFWPAMLVIAITAWLNIVLTLRWRTTTRLDERHAALLLAFDIIQLASLLYLTGGLYNPFSFLFLAPVIISAASLPSDRTMILGGLALFLITALAFFHMPLPWWPGQKFEPPPLYVWGMWGALVSGIVFTALYVHRVARETREMAEALAAAELALARQQQLYALDGLAAAAAHELGTPLATISVVARELRRECPEDTDACPEERRGFCEDLDLLVSQAERCREILSRLADHRAQSDTMLARVKFTVMLEEIIEPVRGPDLDVRLEIIAREGPDGRPSPEPVIRRNPGILYGLGNIVENASDFAESEVVIEAEWDDEEIAVTIMDDGTGFSEAVIDRLGEPFVTTRDNYYAGLDGTDRDGRVHGMGLGFFIAKTLLERTGAVLGLANRPAPEHGAIVRVAWPRHLLEADNAA